MPVAVTVAVVVAVAVAVAVGVAVKEWADIVVDNFRSPNIMKGWGYGYEELKKWKEFDYFLIETYNYVKNEKSEQEGKSNNPFTDSIFIRKFKNVTYKIIYDSAKAFRDSAYHKSPQRENYQNITEWANEKFPLFSKFNREYNKYLNN